MNKEEILKLFSVRKEISTEALQETVLILYEHINKLKEKNEELKKYLEEDDWSSVNGEIASKLILDKIKQLEEGVKTE